MVNPEDRKEVFAQEKQKHEVRSFCEKPMETNDDVKKWKELLAEASRDLSVTLDNGQTVPKKLAAKKLETPFKEAIKMTKSGEQSLFQGFLAAADPRQIDAMEKELQKAGIDTEKMAFLGSGNNSTVLIGKNKEGLMVAIKPTFNKDEATPEVLCDYNFRPEVNSVISADGNKQEKMEKKDGSVGLAVNPIAIPLEVLTDHLKKKYDISDDVMLNRERDIENVICKTLNIGKSPDKQHLYSDFGQTRENVGVIPPNGDLYFIDTGSSRPVDNFMKNGVLKPNGENAKNIMDEKASKVPNITEGFSKAPEKEQMSREAYNQAKRAPKEEAKSNNSQPKTANVVSEAQKRLKER